MAGNAQVTILGLAYVLSSCLLMLMNSWVVKAFSYPATIILWQNFLATVVLLIHKRFRVRSVIAAAGGFHAFVIALVFAIVLLTGMLPLVSVPVESVVVGRACGTAVVAVLEFVLLNERLNQGAIASIGVIILGAIVYAGSGGYVAGYAALFVAINSFATVIYNILSRANAKRGASAVALGLTNNLFTLLPLAMLSAGEFSAVPPPPTSDWPWLALNVSAVLGFVISTAGLALRGHITATSFTVLANVNKLGTVGLAALLRDTPLSTHAMIGIVLTVIGGTTYSVAKSSVAAKR
eukprot:TRINITY_DN13519_c0_g1_i1.p1 TRINITY_DN13519_c0_g1~~TRINITY_DN13519_c0_g1_i1.p1  ORF type:complete len:294 (+),score=66.62 TRINITY_DN13519_c0_g1_i1:43-924(+)